VLHVLVVKMTWGAEPFTDAQVDTAMRAADAFFQTGSFGQLSLNYTQTPWLNALIGPPACGYSDAPSLGKQWTPLVAAAGYDPSAYDRLVFLIPDANCGYAGVYEPAGIILNGVLDSNLVVHELAEGLGMGDPGVISCHYRGSVSFCHTSQTDDPADVMAGIWTPGITYGDFGALQKARAGWLSSVTQVDKNGVYTLGALEQTSGAAQALLIQAAAYQYWVDHREPIGNDAYLASDSANGVASGFAVHREVGDPDLTQNRDYPLIPDYLVPEGKQNRYYTAPGQSFILPNLFELTALTHKGAEMTIRFRWLDTTKPTSPKIAGVTGSNTPGSPLTVSFKPSNDRGSGVAAYLISVDDHQTLSEPAPAQQPRQIAEPLPVLPAGKHSLTITAVDRAGNRSASARTSLNAP